MNKNIIKTIVFFAILFLGYLFFKFQKIKGNEISINYEFKGIVDSIGYTPFKKRAFMYISGKEFGLNAFGVNINDGLNKGDSLVKIKGSRKLFHYKKNISDFKLYDTYKILE